MAQVKEPIYFEASGTAQTGLTPTATAEDTHNGQVITCTVAEMNSSGWYLVSFSGKENHKYAISVDSGSASSDNQYQAFSLTAIVELPKRGGGGGGVTTLTKAQMEFMVDEFKKGVPTVDIPKVEIPDHNKTLKGLETAIKKFEKKVEDFTQSIDIESVNKTIESKIGSFRADLDKELSDIRQEIGTEIQGFSASREENIRMIKGLFDGFKDQWNELNKEFGETLRELKAKIESSAIEGENVEVFEQFMESKMKEIQDQTAGLFAKFKEFKQTK